MPSAYCIGNGERGKGRRSRRKPRPGRRLDDVSERDIVELNIPTGVPLLYELDAQLEPLDSRYLGDPAAVAAAAEAVRRQTEKR